MNHQRFFAVAGALLASLGVVLGAYHAHGLEKWLADQQLQPAEVSHRMDNAAVAVRYLMYHSLGLLIIGTLGASRPSGWLSTGGWLLCVGLLMFSGGLLLIVFTGQAIHWAIVPLGGLIWIIAWLCVALGLALSGRTSREGTPSS